MQTARGPTRVLCVAMTAAGSAEHDQDPEPTEGQGLDFEIVTPPDWWELPVLGSDLRSAVTAVVDERLALNPAVAPDRDTIIAGLLFAARQARASGAIYAAQVGVRMESSAFALALVVALRQLPLRPGHEAADILSVVSALRHDGAVVADPNIELVTLGALGPGVREHELAEADHSPITTISYWFPLVGTGQVALIKVTAPDAVDAEELFPLLDQIVSTISITPRPAPPLES